MTLQTSIAIYWTEQERQTVIDAVTQAVQCKAPFTHICVVGSRCMGFIRSGSDLDIMTYKDGYTRKPEHKSVYQIEIAGIDASIIVRDTLRLHEAVPPQGVILPKFDLMDNAMMDIVPADINTWLDWRISQAAAGLDRGHPEPYDWNEGRDYSQLIVNRT
jgi:hypothetical protein